MKLPKNFVAKTLEATKRIPYGKTASYSQVAALVGSPRWARQVGGALRNYGGEEGVPWWRVINSKGGISVGGDPFRPTLQKKLLLKEGVEFDERGRVLKKHFVSF